MTAPTVPATVIHGAAWSIDIDRLLADWPARTSVRLTPERRAGLLEFLALLAIDRGFTMVRELAYVAATVEWETGRTFRPIRERRAMPADVRLRQLQDRYWPSGFYGRGYVQLTWEGNYRTASKKLAGLSFATPAGVVAMTPTLLVEQPDLLLAPAISYAVCAHGMREGWFTGRKLAHYVTEGAAPDYRNARRIINGTDQAETIAAMAARWELLFRAGATRVAAAH